MGNVEAVAAISPDLGDALAKVAVFALVQGLIYLILRKSSDIFSTATAGAPRSRSFRPMRTMSVRRVLRRPLRRSRRRWLVRVTSDGGADWCY